MKRFFYILLAAIALAACNPNSGREPLPNPGPEVYPTIKLSARVSWVKMHEISVDIDVPGAATYYVGIFKADEFEGKTKESLVEDMRKSVAAGAFWKDYMRIDPQTVTFSDLEADTAYKVIAFGMIDKGITTSDAVVLDVRTLDYKMTLGVSDVTPFSFNVKVTTTRPEFSWWGILYTASVLESEDFELTVLEDFRSGSDDIMDYFGQGDETISYSGFVEPGDEYVFALLGLDENGEPAVPMIYQTISVPSTGIHYVAEDTDGLIHAGIFTEGDDLFGVSISAISDDAEFYIYLFDYNDGVYYGYQLDQWSQDRMDSFLLSLAAAEYDTQKNYAPEGSSSHDIASRAFRSFKENPALYDIWNRASFEYIMKQPVSKATVAVAGLSVSDDGTISIIGDHALIVKSEIK